jgi:hypothetical protein
MIGKNPELLDLHGFSHTRLQELGLTQVEVAYLIASFATGRLYYQNNDKKELTEYRKALLGSEKVRTAWVNVLRGTFIIKSDFSDMVDENISSSFATRP